MARSCRSRRRSEDRFVIAAERRVDNAAGRLTRPDDVGLDLAALIRFRVVFSIAAIVVEILDRLTGPLAPGRCRLPWRSLPRRGRRTHPRRGCRCRYSLGWNTLLLGEISA